MKTHLSAFVLMVLTSFSAQALSATFDVNDVSILYPPIATQAEANNYLNFSFQADKGPLFSEQDFNSLVQFSGILNEDPGFPGADYSQWKLFALRFDPCAKGDPLKDQCHVELRLIFQPFAFTPLPLIQDNAIHLIYELPGSKSDELVQAFASLKSQNPDVITKGKPLGIHPGFVKQGTDGSFARTLKKIIQTLAGRSVLRDATSVFSMDMHEWRFTKSSMTNGQLVQVSIPFSSEMVMTLNSSNMTGQTKVLPASTAPDNINEIVDSIGKIATNGIQGQFFKLPEAQQNAAVDMALRVDNPLLNGPTSTDCLSCHQASRALVRVMGREFLSVQDGNTNRFVMPAGVTSTLQISPFSVTTYSMRAFGYSNLDTNPELTQGVLNSSADVANRINKYFGVP